MNSLVNQCSKRDILTPNCNAMANGKSTKVQNTIQKYQITCCSVEGSPAPVSLFFFLSALQASILSFLFSISFSISDWNFSTSTLRSATNLERVGDSEPEDADDPLRDFLGKKTGEK